MTVLPEIAEFFCQNRQNKACVLSLVHSSLLTRPCNFRCTCTDCTIRKAEATNTSPPGTCAFCYCARISVGPKLGGGLASTTALKSFICWAATVVTTARCTLGLSCAGGMPSVGQDGCHELVLFASYSNWVVSGRN